MRYVQIQTVLQMYSLNNLFFHINQQTYSSETIEKFEICDDLKLCLKKLHQNSNLAVAVSRELARDGHFRLAPQLYCFQKSEIIYDYLLKFLVRKHFPYLHELNDFVRTASESGLIEKWHTPNLNRNIINVEPIECNGIAMSDFIVLVVIYILLKIGSFFLLFLEKLVYKNVRKRNASGMWLKFWLYAEMAIDPDRHFFKEMKLN